MKRITVCTLLILFLGLLLTSLNYPSKKYHYKNEDEVTAFNALTRQQQVEKCGSCHKQEYENEKIGPHANAYDRLMQHVNYVNSSAYNHPEYARYVNENLATCFKCHAGDNLFETCFKNYNTDTSLAQNIWNGPRFFPENRPQNISLTTGIDCITCHYNGTNVVTNTTFKKSHLTKSPAYCSPEPSAFFSSDIRCMSCHYKACQDMTYKAHTTAVNNVTCSSSCHQEFKNGKGTHYYWWTHNPDDKKQPVVLGGIFNDISCNYSNKVMSVKWKNNYLPHTFAQSGELLLKVEVKNANKELIYTEVCRINNKFFHDSTTLQYYFGSQPVPGIQGKQFTGSNTEADFQFNLPQHKGAPFYADIYGGRKGQFWFDDSTTHWVYKNTIVIKQ